MTPEESIRGALSGSETLHPELFPAPSDDLVSVLDRTPVHQTVKADAFDAFHAAKTPEEFTAHFDALPLPKEAKADLFDLKFGTGTGPGTGDGTDAGLPFVPNVLDGLTPPKALDPYIKPQPAYRVKKAVPPPVVAAGPDYAAMSRAMALNPPAGGDPVGLPPGLIAQPPVSTHSAPPLPTPTKGMEIAPPSVQIGEPPAIVNKPMPVSVLRRIPGTEAYRSQTGTPPPVLVPGSKPQGERMTGAGNVVGGTNPEDMTTGQLIKTVAETPLVSPEDIDNAFPFLVGPFALHKGLLKSAAGMTSPENAAIALGTAGLGAVPGAAGRILGTGMSALFATQAGKALMDKYEPLKAAVTAGDWEKALEIGGESLGDAAMAAAAATHAIHGAMEVPGEVRGIARDLHDRYGPAKSVSGEVLDRIDPFAGQGQIGGPTTPPTYEGTAEPGEPPPPGSGPGPKDKPDPVANTAEYLKAHSLWKKATTEAATKFMEENPGATWEQAHQAVDGTVGKEPNIDDYKPVPRHHEPPPVPEPPEPEPPTQSESISEHTPNPPTAATATEPESPETIALQMQQLTEGVRRVVMFPKGQGLPDYSSFPPNVSVHHDDYGNIYVFRPDLIKRSAISHAANNNTLTDILGHSTLGMGAPDKSALHPMHGGPGMELAVVGRGPDGTEAQTTVTDQKNLSKTIAATHALIPPGGTVTVVSPDQALAQRTGEEPPPPPQPDLPPPPAPQPDLVGTPEAIGGEETGTPQPEAIQHVMSEAEADQFFKDAHDDGATITPLDHTPGSRSARVQVQDGPTLLVEEKDGQWHITEQSAPAASVSVHGTPEGAAPTSAAADHVDSSLTEQIAVRETGERGPVYREFRHDEAGATNALEKAQNGEAIGALQDKKFGRGDVDLVWGYEGNGAPKWKGGFGLAHILIKHPWLKGHLQEMLDRMTTQTPHGPERVDLSNEQGEHAVLALTWFGRENKTWLLTEYDPQVPEPGRILDGSGNPVSGAGEPTSPPGGNPSITKPLTTREQATAVKDLDLDTSEFDTKTVEGRKQLAEAIAKERSVSAVDKSVHDLPVKATVKDGQITAVIRYQRKPVATITISPDEWQKTLEHPNPNYTQRQLAAKKLDQSDINVFVDNSDNERMNSGVVDRLADSVVNAVRGAMKLAAAQSAPVPEITSPEKIAAAEAYVRQMAPGRNKDFATDHLSYMKGERGNPPRSGSPPYERVTPVAADLIVQNLEERIGGRKVENRKIVTPQITPRHVAEPEPEADAEEDVTPAPDLEAAETGVESNGEAEPAEQGEPADAGRERSGTEDTPPLGEVSSESSESAEDVGTTEPDRQPGGRPARTDVQPDVEGGTGSGSGGRTGTGAVDQSGAPGTRRPTGDLTKQTTGGDFRIAPSDHIGEGTPRQKLADNLDAIRTVKAIEAAGRPATPEEQAKLAKYVGWGGLWQIFDIYKREFSGAREELRQLLTPEEFTAAEKSVKNAHYTSPEVITSMWNAVQRLGVTPGFSVLEPSMGVGSFFGLQPDALMPARRTGVEIDKITGAIAKALYPDSNVQISGFEKMALPNNFFDVAIGNVPFGDYPVYDPEYNRNPVAVRAIHNYFFVKSLDLVRPGGIVSFITSRYTMDAQDIRLRQLLAGKADLIGMMRLPNTAFKGNAGTQVVTDLVFLRKRAEGEAPAGASFENVREVTAADGRQTTINEYYADHPEMLLGTLSTEGTQYGPNQQTLEGTLTPEILQTAVERLPQNVYTEWKADTPAFQNHDYIQLGDEVKDGGYTVKNGVVVQREGNIYRPAVLGKTQEQRIRGMIPVKAALRQVFSTQLSEGTEQEILAARKALNRSYDAFVKQHGPLGSVANSRALGDDPDYAPLAGALEDYDRESKTATKTDIFSKRTIETPDFPNSADTATAALALVLNERGRLDWNRMQELTGKTPEELREELGGQVFQNPDGRQWETQDEYLSGNVRKKLEIAEGAARTDSNYQRNVEALLQVQPKDLLPEEIKITPGAPWIPPDTVAEFIQEVLGIYGAKVFYSPAVATWSVKVEKREAERLTNRTFGSDKFLGHQLFDLALNGKAPKVYRPGPNDTRVFDPSATAAAQAAQDALKDRFREWIWDNPERAEMLAGKYNRDVNNLRTVDHDGSHLTMPGSNPAVTLKPHQKNVIWRALKTGNTLLAHEVGAGKTWEMVGIAMESRRLGLAKKPILVVPNHMAEQMTNEFLQLYPAARILTIGKEDFAADKRKRAVSRIAGGSWDAVIIRHSSFEKIPVSDATFQAFIDKQVAELRAALEQQTAEVGKDAKKDKTVKEIQKAISKLEVRLERHLKRDKKDDAVTFEQLGIDLMLVDEAHAFKALPVVSRRTRVAGIPTRQSDRATDMYMKTQYISELNGGRRGVIFATGTPVTNTMAELYNMQRYLQPKALKDAGVEHFDAWANMFGDVRRGVELDVSGKGFRENTRFAKFINIPELMTMYRQVADVKTAEMLNLPRPELFGGGPQAITAPESPELTAYVDHLIDRSDAVRTGTVDKRDDNMLKIVSEGKKAALDMRLVDPEAEDRPTSKVNKAVANIYRIWNDTQDQRATQAVFCDLSVPKSAKSKKKAAVAPEQESTEADDAAAVPEAAGERAGFSVYDDMREKLIANGVPPGEIAFIHDYSGDEAKQELFDAVNAGRVRILLGSTEKMGVGTNIQRRMIALHHLDAPWRPADIKQRDGRIQRQGNLHPSVHIFQYLTEGSFDAYSWQILENKAAFLTPILAGESNIREMEDIGMVLPSAAEFKAMASGNPLIKEKIGTDAELGRLEAQRESFRRQQSGMRQDLIKLPEKIESLNREIARKEADFKTVTENKDSGYTIGTEHFEGEDARKRAAEALDGVLRSWKGVEKSQEIGSFRGMSLWTTLAYGKEIPDLILRGQGAYIATSNTTNPLGTLGSIEGTVRASIVKPLWLANQLEDDTAKLKQLKTMMNRPWQHESRYQDLIRRKAEIDGQLEESQAERAASEDDDDEDKVRVRPIPRGTSYQDRKRIQIERARVVPDDIDGEKDDSEQGSIRLPHLAAIAAIGLVLSSLRKKDLTGAMEEYDALPDDQKKAAYRTARDKAMAARSKLSQWTPKARALAKKYFNMTPFTPHPPPPPALLGTPQPFL